MYDLQILQNVARIRAKKSRGYEIRSALPYLLDSTSDNLVETTIMDFITFLLQVIYWPITLMYYYPVPTLIIFLVCAIGSKIKNPLE
jgi:hypothetical protein